MSHLLLTIRFLDARYHGKADAGEPEWPPSPMRLFCALLAGAKSSWSDRRREAFLWLERQPPPAIRSPQAGTGRELLTYVPNNNSDSGQTMRTAKVITPMLLSHPPVIEYLWEIDSRDEPHAQVIADAARHVRALGWGIDLAVGHGSVPHVCPPAPAGFEVLRPRVAGVGGGTSLRVPVHGSLESLEDAYAASLERIRASGEVHDQPRPPVCEQTVYAGSVARPFCAFSFQTADEEVMAFRPQQLKELVGLLRHAASSDMVRTAVEKQNGIKPSDQTIQVDRQILGHPPDASGPRLSFLPLPSIGHAHSDGQIRRVILLETAGSKGSLSRLLYEVLHGRVLEPVRASETPLPSGIVLARLAPTDRFLRYYTREARAWASVTPVLLPGYDDRKQHRGNQQKRLTRAEQLLCKAMAQAGIDASAQVEISRVPWWPGTLHALEYQPREKLADYPRWHVRLTFDRPWTGPLAIGAGRHAGFGVMAACQ